MKKIDVVHADNTQMQKAHVDSNSQMVIEIQEVEKKCGQTKWALPIDPWEVKRQDRAHELVFYGCLRIKKYIPAEIVKIGDTTKGTPCSSESRRERKDMDLLPGHVYGLWSNMKEGESCVEFTRNASEYPPPETNANAVSLYRWGYLLDQTTDSLVSPKYEFYLLPVPIRIKYFWKKDPRKRNWYVIAEKTTTSEIYSENPDSNKAVIPKGKQIVQNDVEKKEELEKSTGSNGNNNEENATPGQCYLNKLSEDIRQISADGSHLLAYVALPKVNGYVEKLPVYEWDEATDTFLKREGEPIDNILAGNTDFIRIESHSHQEAKYQGVKLVQEEKHFASIPDLNLQKYVLGRPDPGSRPIYNIRVVSSANGLKHLNLPALQSIYNSSKKTIKLNIVWSEVTTKGVLAGENKQFDSFQKLDEQMEDGTRVRLSQGSQVARLFNEINASVTDVDFDHMIIVKGPWIANLKTAEALSSLINKIKSAVSEKDTPKILDVFSEQTTAYGNDYLKIAIRSNLAGEFYEERAYDGDKAGIVVFPSAQKFWKRMYETAVNIQTVKKRRKVTTESKLVVDVHDIAQSTGYILPSNKYKRFLDIILAIEELLTRAPYSDGISRKIRDVTLRDYFRQEKMLLLPQNSADFYSRSMISELGQNKKRKVVNALKNIKIQITEKYNNSKNSCIYINDSIFR